MLMRLPRRSCRLLISVFPARVNIMPPRGTEPVTSAPGIVIMVSSGDTPIGEAHILHVACVYVYESI